MSEEHDHPTFINSTYSRTYNVPSTHSPPTFVATVDDDKNTSCEKKTTNPKIQALVNAIINDDDGNDPKRHVKPSAVIHEGFSIVPPTTTTTYASKTSRVLAPESSQSALVMKEEPVMKKFKLSSKEDIRNIPQSKHIEYSDSDDDAESPVNDSDDDDDNDVDDHRKMHHPRTKGQIMGYKKR